jgi:hypothetical protein
MIVILRVLLIPEFSPMLAAPPRSGKHSFELEREPQCELKLSWRAGAADAPEARAGQ